MEGKLPDNGSGHILELKLNPIIANVWVLLPPTYDNHRSSMPPPKTNVRKIHPLQKLLPFNVKKIKVHQILKGQDWEQTSLVRHHFFPSRHHLSHTSCRRRGSEAGHSRRAHQHQQWHGGCWHQHP